jgi:hypothetical protein
LKPIAASASASSTAKIGGLSGKTPCSGCFLESAVGGDAARDLVVLRLIFLAALALATFLVVFFLAGFSDFFIGVFLSHLAFALRPAIASPQIVWVMQRTAIFDQKTRLLTVYFYQNAL